MGVTSTSHTKAVSTPVFFSVLASCDRLWLSPPRSGRRPVVLVLAICDLWLTVAHYFTTTSFASEIVFTSRARQRRSIVVAYALLRPMMVRSILDLSFLHPQESMNWYLLPFVTFLRYRIPRLVRRGLVSKYVALSVFPADNTLNFILHRGHEIRFISPFPSVNHS